MAGVSWMSKHRFAAKRLHTLATEISPEKRTVIETNSAFRALLNVSPFKIPPELIDFIAIHTTPALREFKYHKNRIVFTREMVRKVFGIRCGNRAVQLLKKSEHCELREVYKGGASRPDIHIAVDLLKNCEDTDEDTIIRTWDMICLATVVDPGSGNMLSLDYLASMFDPRRTHEFAWDEHLLELAMQEVQKIQKKKASPMVLEGGATKFDFWTSGPFALLGIVYMDHLEFPPNEHVMNYSTPRACFVTTSDFKFVIANDLDRKILNNTTVFRRRPFLNISQTPYAVVGPADDPVPEPVEDVEVNPSASLNEWLVFPSSQDLEVPDRFKHLHDKHKALFASDVDVTLNFFAVGLKSMQSKRMAALLIDVDAAIKEGDGPSVAFATGDDGPNDISSQDQGRAKDCAGQEADGSQMGVSGSSAQVEEGDVQGAKEGADAAKQGDGDKAEEKDGEDDNEETTDDDEHMDLASKYRVLVHARSKSPDVPQTAVVLDPLATGDGDDGQHVDSPSRLPAPGGDADAQLLVQSPSKSPVALQIEDDANVQHVAHSPSRSPFRSGPPDSISAEAWSNAPDPPSFDIFSQDDAVDKPAELPTKEAVASPKVTMEATKDIEAQNVLSEPVTPNHVSSTDVVSMEGKHKDASTGIVTLEKKNRHKRAAKDDPSPVKTKKIKVSQEAFRMYDKFVIHGRKYKRQSRSKKAAPPKPFVRIGHFFCSYRTFHDSFRPRQCLSNEVMSVWLEKFNHVAKSCADKNNREKKKYAFSPYMSQKLSVDPSIFKPADCMNEFKEICSKFKILKGDLLYFPLVADNHWIVPCINMLYKQFHIFDSMMSGSGASSLDREAKNLFSNFVRLANESTVCSIDFGPFKHVTPKHPHQDTLFDCGFYAILFMEYYNAKVMAHFDNDAIPDFRKLLAASIIESRDNHQEDVEKIMEEELQFA